MMIKMSLDEVLEGYAVETPTGNDQQILRKWMTLHPEFAAELMDFAAMRVVAQLAPEEAVSPEEEKRYQEIGLNNLRAVLSKNMSLETAFSSLTALAAEKGLDKRKFASAAGISLSLLMYLEKKRLEFSTIPKSLIKKISDVLEAGEERVSAYLNQPSDWQTQVSYKAAIRPEAAKLKSFSEAVEEDQMLSPEEKKRLLDLD